MKKNILLIILLISISISAAYAAENTSGEDQSFPLFTGTFFYPLSFSQDIDQEMNDDIFSGNPNYYKTGYDKFGGFGKFMLGFGNIFLGLGSLIAGEWRDTLKLDLNYFLSAGIAVGGFILVDTFYKFPLAGKIIFFGMIGDILFISLGAVLMPVGVYMFVRTIVDGFLYPYGIGSSPSSNRNIKQNPLLNLRFDILPTSDGNTAGQLSYIIRY